MSAIDTTGGDAMDPGGAARSVETVIVGAGHAGLIVSSILRREGREHLLVDRRSSLGGGWQDRWDDFQLVSPNWTTAVQGFPHGGSDPDGFMPRDEIVAHFRAFAAAIQAPVQLETDVTRLTRLEDGAARFLLETSRGPIRARNVVVAGGPFQRPHLPPPSAALDQSVSQVHVNDYRNPAALPPGGVLLVGSGQSGVQLAEELMAAGRSVTMAVGRCGRVPRTWRGTDLFWWMRALATRGPALGTGLPTAAGLPGPRARFACNPQLSGHGERHDINLRAMARDGLRLAGRLDGAEGTRIRFADDLGDSLRFADGFFAERFKPLCDVFAERAGLSLPEDEVAQVDFEPAPVTELDLAAEGISTVLWTSGYRPAFDWIELPVLDDFGLPLQQGGLTEIPGLGFLGTPWMVDMGSANLVAVERDAEALAANLSA
jgi:putative flavoprotein involved in K+ transport